MRIRALGCHRSSARYSVTARVGRDVDKTRSCRRSIAAVLAGGRGRITGIQQTNGAKTPLMARAHEVTQAASGSHNSRPD